MTSSKRAPAWPRMACKRSKVRCVCGPMPPETSLPSVPRPVSPAVNRTREGLTLIPGMKPRPRSTGRSARISRRSIVPSFASRNQLRVGGAILRSRAQRRQGDLVSHREPFAVRSAQVESGRKGLAMDVMIVRVLIAPVGVAVVLVRAWEDGRGPRQRDRVQGSLGPLTHIADDKERAHDRRRRHHPESGLSRAYLL